MITRLTTFSAAGLLAASMLFAASASAAPQTVNLQYTGSLGGLSGQISWSGDNPPSVPRSATATEFGFNVTGGTPGETPVPNISFGDRIEAFCVQLGVPVGSGVFAVHTANEYFANSSTVDLLGRLYGSFYAMVSAETATNLERAAFQLAIWEIVYDTPEIDLALGEFAAVSGFGAARDLAASWLADISTNAGPKRTIYILHNAEQQDIIITVPEPGTLLLIGSGLLLGVGLRRRYRA
jgi:hypothetical protein